MNKAIFILRLVFGALFIWSGIGKLKDPILFADAIRNYQLIGDPLIAIAALFLPWLEVIAGLAAMTDRWARGGLAILNGCLVFFTLAIGLAWARGLDISCGCFGSNETLNYPVKVSQNIGLIVLGLTLGWREELARRALQVEVLTERASRRLDVEESADSRVKSER